MSATQASGDTLLLAIPMLTVMFAGIFRLDELFSNPAQSREQGHRLSGWDESGRPMCIEPDGTVYCDKTRRSQKPEAPAPCVRRVLGIRVEPETEGFGEEGGDSAWNL